MTSSSTATCNHAAIVPMHPYIVKRFLLLKRDLQGHEKPLLIWSYPASTNDMHAHHLYYILMIPPALRSKSHTVSLAIQDDFLSRSIREKKFSKLHQWNQTSFIYREKDARGAGGFSTAGR